MLIFTIYTYAENSGIEQKRNPDKVAITKTEKKSTEKKSTEKKSTTRCKATTKDGTQCKRNAEKGSIYCWQHKKKTNLDEPK